MVRSADTASCPGSCAKLGCLCPQEGQLRRPGPHRQPFTAARVPALGPQLDQLPAGSSEQEITTLMKDLPTGGSGQHPPEAQQSWFGGWGGGGRMLEGGRRGTF